VGFSERFRRFLRSAGIIQSNPRLLGDQNVSRLCRFSVPLLLRPQNERAIVRERLDAEVFAAFQLTKAQGAFVQHAVGRGDAQS